MQRRGVLGPKPRHRPRVMSNVVRNIAGFPRSLAGRVGMITLLAVVLISTAALQVALPCKPSLERADLSDYGDTGKILVVMVFAGMRGKGSSDCSDKFSV